MLSEKRRKSTSAVKILRGVKWTYADKWTSGVKWTATLQSATPPVSFECDQVTHVIEISRERRLRQFIDDSIARLYG